MNTAIEIEDYGVHRFIQAFGEATATPTTANTPKIRPITECCTSDPHEQYYYFHLSLP